MRAEELTRLKNHVELLLDLAIGTVQRFKIVHPLLSEQDTIERLSAGDRRRGFQTLVHILYWDFVKEISKLTFDDFKRTPSIFTVSEKLRCSGVREHLRAVYTVPKSPAEFGPQRMSAQYREYLLTAERGRLESEFDSTFDRILTRIDAVLVSPTLRAYKDVRDKNIAHSEVEVVNGRYQFVDIKKLGLKYGDEVGALAEITDIIQEIFQIVCGSRHVWEDSFQMFEADAACFWSPS